MLYAWGFERVGVVAGDLYFVDPDPSPGQEGAERGVRLEVRLLDRPPLTGSIYAAQPIVIDRPVWRADLFETVAGAPGSHDRTHHHPHFRGWEPGTAAVRPGPDERPDRVARRSAHPPARPAGRGRDRRRRGWIRRRPGAGRGRPRDRRTRWSRCCARVRAGELGRAPVCRSSARAWRTGAAAAPASGAGSAGPLGGARAGWL